MLDAVVHETLRVRPVLTVAPRRLAEPLVVDGRRLPAGRARRALPLPRRAATRASGARTPPPGARRAGSAPARRAPRRRTGSPSAAACGGASGRASPCSSCGPCCAPSCARWTLEPERPAGRAHATSRGDPPARARGARRPAPGMMRSGPARGPTMDDPMPITRDVALPLREVVVRASRSSGPRRPARERHRLAHRGELRRRGVGDAQRRAEGARAGALRARSSAPSRRTPAARRATASSRSSGSATAWRGRWRCRAPATRPGRRGASQERRLEAKRRAASRKRGRRPPSGED